LDPFFSFPIRREGLRNRSYHTENGLICEFSFLFQDLTSHGTTVIQELESQCLLLQLEDLTNGFKIANSEYSAQAVLTERVIPASTVSATPLM
jgi:hypothetical protein